jgi:hypothetical protein
MNVDRTVEALQRELSRRSRLGHVLLLLAAASGLIVVVSVWATEPALPLRTHLAFLTLTVVCLAWAVHAVWVLRRRAILFVPHRVRAALIATSSAGAFMIGALAVWWSTGATAALFAASSGVVWLAIATVLLVRARQHRAALQQRLRELEHVS